MLVKLGVYIDSLKWCIRRKLNEIDDIFKLHKHEAVITSTNEADHTPSSLHYANCAVDFRLPIGVVAIVSAEMKKALGGDYEVITEKQCIHVGYIKGSKIQ